MTSIHTTFYQKIKRTTILSNSTIFHNRINSSHTWILFFRWILQPGYYFSGKLDYRTLFFSKFRLVPQIGHYSTVTNFHIACILCTSFFIVHSFSSISVNLSIADTMVSSLNVTFNFVFMLTGDWPFGNVYCKMSSFISIISVCGSVFTLVAIAADR